MSVKMDPRTEITINNFKSATQTLEKFIVAPIIDDRDRAGIIQAFEFCYELAWKSLKKIAEERGLEAPTPLQDFQVGFQMGFLLEEEHQLWLDMKLSRNLTSHTYKEDLAIQVCSDIISRYLPAFKGLLMRMSS